MEKAVRKGINFFDTAELYGNYPQFKRMFEMGVERDQIVIATKSYSYDRITAQRSLDKALNEIGTDYIDMFLLHEQESQHTLRGHQEAIDFFLEMKEKGVIKAFGISTHHLAALEAVLERDEIQVVHPIVNLEGIGIVDGTMESGEKILRALKERGKFIYAMKPLGGGHLIDRYEEAMSFALSRNYLDAIAIGMQSESELEANVLTLMGKKIPEELAIQIDKIERKLLIHDWCIGCGKCVEKCQHHALSLVDGKAVVNPERCVFCGYCSKVCPEMCIKVI
jgi:aryl-alcohol dehydrogenase-like predicted oxidoreductase